ncbi:protein kinase domain-containing protein [Leptolyngbya sp. AN03gr2]|uniref:protein kinase domain-containing protein n=1 Tax=unclassified Leptolyngbya TaxID=2650499 RepID=UPI003D3103D4
MIGQGELLIERYLIVKQLGSGGFSKTYLVLDKHLPGNPQCILKQLCFQGHNTLTLEDARTLFEKEANFLYMLGRTHDRIPGLLAHIKDEDHPCLIEEFIEGKNLESYVLEGKQLKPKEAIALLRDVLSTLDFIHQKNIIHQDIKPSNLIQRESDKAFAVIDFGAAVHPKEPPFKDLTFGTPGYVPQEQRAGEPAFASDLYALGITTIQLMTGIHPQQLRKDPMSNEIDWQFYLKGKGTPNHLREVLTRLTRSNVKERYQSASEALAALNLSQSTTAPVGKTPESLVDSSDLRQQTSPSNRRFPWVPLTALSMTVIVGAAIALSKPESPFYAVKETVVNQLDTLQAKQKMQIELVKTIATRDSITKMLMSSDRYLITVDDANTITVINIQTGKTTARIKDAPDRLTKLAVSPNGQWLFGTSNSREVTIWNLATGQAARSFTLKEAAIEAVAFSPDSRTIATSTQNHQMQLWDVGSGKMVRTLENRMLNSAGTEANINCMFFAPNQLIIGATTNNRMKVWDANTGSLKRVFSGHSELVDTMQISRDGRILYSFGRDRAIAWDINANKIVSIFPRESAGVTNVRWSGEHLLTLHENGNVRLWDPQSGRLIETLTTVQGKTAVSDKAQYLANAVNQEIKIWKINPAENKTHDVQNF